MEKRTIGLYKAACVFAMILALVMLFVLFVAAFFCRSEVAMNSSEKVSFHRNGKVVYCFLALFVVLFWKLRAQIQKLNGEKLFTTLTIAYLLVGTAFIYGLGVQLRADADLVRMASEQFAAGNFSMMERGGYFFRYPFQLGLATYEQILNLLSHNVKILFCANLFFTLLINFTTWKTACILFPDKIFVQNLTILLSFLFLPQFFFIAFAYGTIPGWAMLMLAFYSQLRFLKDGKKRYLFIMVIAATISCLLKGNYLIGVIAMGIVFVLEGINRKKQSYFIILLAMILVISGSNKCLNFYYEVQSGESTKCGEPKLLWVAMGLRDKSPKCVGWWDRFNGNTFENVDYSVEEANKIAKESIKESMQRFVDSPEYAVKFFGKKIISTWCDPLFQSLWSGPLLDCEQTFNSYRLSLLYDGQSLPYKAVRMSCEVLLIFMYAMAVLFLAQSLNAKEYDRYLLPYIFFIGGFLFHIFWETKSQYVYPYVFAMIPCMASAFDTLCTQIKERKRMPDSKKTSRQ